MTTFNFQYINGGKQLYFYAGSAPVEEWSMQLVQHFLNFADLDINCYIRVTL